MSQFKLRRFACAAVLFGGLAPASAQDGSGAPDTVEGSGGVPMEGSDGAQAEGSADRSAAEAPAAPPTVGRLEVGEVAERMEAGSLRAGDVNTVSVRASQGVIPGATLLSSHEFAVEELGPPLDGPVVFYCYNQSCLAADRAAQWAIEHGFTDVYILPAGIRGWVGAGLTVTPGPEIPQ